MAVALLLTKPRKGDLAKPEGESVRVFKQGRQISRTEKVSVVAIFVLLNLGMGKFLFSNFFNGFADGAGFVSLLDAIREGKGMVSPLYNAPTWIFNLDSSTAISEWCAFEPQNRFENFSQWHPYIILFLVAHLANFLSVQSLLTLTFLTTLSYMTVPLISYLYLRKFTRLGSGITSLIVLSLCITPSWSSGIEGQLQSDRLFIGIGFLVTLLGLRFVTVDPKNKVMALIVIILAVLGVTISERSAIYLILIFTILFVTALSKRHFHAAVMNGIILMCLMFYFAFWKLNVEQSYYYQAASTEFFLSNLISSFTSNLFLTVVFLSSIFLTLTFAALNRIGGILALGLVVPQFLWTVGGAEKIGFSTQYHAGYIGPLIGCSIFGLTSWCAKSSNPIKSILKRIRALSFLQILLLTLSPIWAPSYSHQLNPMDLPRKLSLDFGHNAYLNQVRSEKEKLVSRLPLNNWISSPETFFPVLAYKKHKRVDYFPFGIKDNEFAITTITRDRGIELISPWFEYMLPSDYTKRSHVKKCFEDSLKDFDIIESLETTNGTRYSLVRLVHNK